MKTLLLILSVCFLAIGCTSSKELTGLESCQKLQEEYKWTSHKIPKKQLKYVNGFDKK